MNLSYNENEGDELFEGPVNARRDELKELVERYENLNPKDNKHELCFWRFKPARNRIHLIEDF